MRVATAKYPLFLAVAILLHFPSRAQKDFNDSLAQSRNRITRTAMLTLGSWAVANISSGFIIAGQTTGQTKYFWRMNAYWNFINLGLAGMAYLNAISASAKKYSFADNFEAQHALEKIYIFNFGLDLAYIAGELYLHERGRSATTPNSGDQLKGYGTSIIAQGAFLLLMDGVMIRLHQKNTIRMNKRLRRFDLVVALEVSGSGIAYKSLPSILRIFRIYSQWLSNTSVNINILRTNFS